MKLLVLAADYPKKDGSVALMYIHTRNRFYVQNNIDVTVLNFKATNNYNIDGVNVITLKDYQKRLNDFDILLSHAPNLRNHYLFLSKYEKFFSNIVFFFHGHEVLKVSDIYPNPFPYMKNASKRALITRSVYDQIKVKIWKNKFEKIAHKSQFIFVSNWMFDMFKKYVRLDPEIIGPRKHIIYNCIGKDFEQNSYDYTKEKKYDFITIRNNLDGSKYCIDIITKIAKENPLYKFCVVGRGEFYKYNEKPCNLVWLDKTLNHTEVITVLNESKCALMPTRADAQGVMSCEIATFGIPVITSNIDICKEVFGEFENVGYLNNTEVNINIDHLFKELVNGSNKLKNNKFFAENTISKEIKLFNKLMKE